MRPSDYLESRGLPKGLVGLYGLCPHPEGVVIPVYDPWMNEKGRILRVVDNHRAIRYTTLVGESIRSWAFGLPQCKRKAFEEGVMFVTEGPFDAMALTAAGIPAVAVIGSRISPSQAYWVSRYTDRAIVCFDEGEAARENARKSTEMLNGYVEAASTPPPYGLKDLGEAWERLEKPREGLREWRRALK